MKWFKEVFLPSFEDCKGKRISEKQGMIFEKYLDPEDKRDDNAEYFSKVINGKKIRLQKSGVFNGCYYNKYGRHTNYRNEYYVTIESNL